MSLQQIKTVNRKTWLNCNVESLKVSSNAEIDGTLTLKGNMTISNLTANDLVVDTIVVNTGGKITTPELECLDGPIIERGSVTQTGLITDAVTLNATSGVVTTVASTLAAGASVSFDFNNDKLFPNVLNIQLRGYSGTMGTNGWPRFDALLYSANKCVVTLTNTHPTNALNGTLSFQFNVINAVTPP